MSTAKGFSVRIFIPSGEPDGLRIIEKSNWTGQGLAFPRSLYAEARKRPELKRTGIYILWGPAESGNLPRVYVGEGDQVLSRLDQHAKNKDFWTHACIFISKDQNLNKAHGQHLESRLVRLAYEAKRCELDNGNEPQMPSLSEADAMDAEGYLDDLLLCLPIIGVNFFEKPRPGAGGHHRLYLKSRGVEASGFESPEGFVVLKGSTAARDEVPSIHQYMKALRRTLLENGVLADAGDVFKVTQDYTFSSPSTAAGVILGRSSNGRLDWKDKEGHSLKDLQEGTLTE